MSSSETHPVSPKPSAPPALQCLMRVTGAIALVLFLTPTFYVVKYYALDKPSEENISPFLSPGLTPPQANYLLVLSKRARDTTFGDRTEAIRRIGETLRQPGIGWKRPLECLSAKATLAELATKDADPAVRAAASAELNKVAQNGAIIQR